MSELHQISILPLISVIETISVYRHLDLSLCFSAHHFQGLAALCSSDYFEDIYANTRFKDCLKSQRRGV